ncbi:MAG: hypothetical protein COB54_08945 [Alphaproteobacteria bacterium]|nr:MAG: hypothetical protein COB54_08945 [Alphaproteobacteria bacterium]
MTDRTRLCRAFLDRQGWGDAHRQPLADDASFRRYERLTRGDERAVLMDAPPEFEDVVPFVSVAVHLQVIGLAAPVVMARDPENGFLLLEDMGDDLFARVIKANPDQEKDLYQLAIQGLVHLHQAVLPEQIAPYDEDLLLQELGLFVDWYLPALTGRPLSDGERQTFLTLWRQVLTPVSQARTCLTLRDYHAENLMIRAGQKGLSRLGLLDFQDAVIGHPAYDLVSLLQDARRDVSPALEQEMLSDYITETGADSQDFHRDYALLGAQRNAKIIGIFTRLCLRDGKAAYLGKIPRVWALLERDLAHPALAPVRQWMDEHIAPSLRSTVFTPLPSLPGTAMILAAGLGQRMRPLTATCPKPLITVAGKELLSYSLEGLCAAGVRDVVINSHYLADQMEQFVDRYRDPRLSLTLSPEPDQLLDSGGGVKNALNYLGDAPFFVLNSDMIWRDGAGGQMLQRLRAFWQPDHMDILMLLVPRDTAVGYDGPGNYNRDDRGRLTIRGQMAQADYVYGGILIMKPDCFIGSPCGAFSLRDQFAAAEQAGRLSGLVHDGAWYHVGTPEVRDAVEDTFKREDV